MIILSLIIFAIIGSLAGFLGGLLGVGGGLVVVPALMLYFKTFAFPETSMMQVAVGTSLGAMVFTSGSSAWAHFKAKSVYWNFFRPLAPGIIIGSFLGALVADYLPSRDLALVFGFTVFWIGIYYLLTPNLKEVKAHYTPHFLVLNVLGVLIGSISSILGIGGGVMTVPMLTAFSIPLRNAISTSAVTGFLIAIFGAVSFLYLGLDQPTFDGNYGYLYPPAFIVIGLTASIAAPYGAKYTYILPVHHLRRILACRENAL